MFMISWWVALITIVVATIVYRLIEVHAARGTWGAEGWWSLSLRIAQQNLWRLESVPQSAPGFWRPQVLAFLPRDRPSFHPHIAALVRQLKKTGGLSIVCQCLVGDLDVAIESGDVAKANQDVHSMLDEVGVEAFVKVTVGKTKLDGMVALLQGAGLGALKPNTVLIPFARPMGRLFPMDPTDSADVSLCGSMDSYSSTPNSTATGGPAMGALPWDSASATELVKVIRSVGLLNKVLLLVKGIDEWPIAVEQHGTIDVYWLVHDGGILRLLPWLLQRHQVWSHCALRVFVFAHASDDPTTMRGKLEESLNQMRIKAQTHVIEIGGQDVSEFAHVGAAVAHHMPESLSCEATSELRRRNQVQALVPTCLAALAIQSPALVRDQVMCKQTCELLDTARQINALIHEHSPNSENGLIVCNLPTLLPHLTAMDYVQYLETLSENIPRMMFVKGNGLEIV
ncbi:hypothetical protein BCR44DRAFT_1220581 [Catenaria anguillulae PL171]|uniref:SLC12A transporter C-terminal domain-containing protein n=1 Tax=Catenaria anguillulae PL171 TaxID=765915 RepID=A0A1Y2I248_9FUNG|nr:hypothetical protein BCR44DRAFT_1220581 [Catenaria anguillulae PL171]